MGKGLNEPLRLFTAGRQILRFLALLQPCASTTACPVPPVKKQGLQDRVGGRNRKEGGVGTWKVLQVLGSEELKQPDES